MRYCRSIADGSFGRAGSSTCLPAWQVESRDIPSKVLPVPLTASHSPRPLRRLRRRTLEILIPLSMTFDYALDVDQVFLNTFVFNTYELGV